MAPSATDDIPAALSATDNVLASSPQAALRDVVAEEAVASRPFGPRSLSRRMLAIASIWVVAMLLVGGFILSRAISGIIVDNFDAQLDGALDTMIASAELSSEGEVRLARPLAEQSFLEPYSGLYWQVSAIGQDPYRSRSLWDRALPIAPPAIDHFGTLESGATVYDMPFGDELLRVVEREASLPGAETMFRFKIAQDRTPLDIELGRIRLTLFWSLALLGAGLMALAAMQAIFGLAPLRRVRAEIAAVRGGSRQRVSTDYVSEVTPLMYGINELLEQAETQADQARLHAGNLAHALKTPMTVLVNESAKSDAPLAEIVQRQTASMQRHVDYQLARARALGRRGALNMRSSIWESLEALRRTIERIYPDRVTIDIDGDRSSDFLGEKQDLEEMLGNLMENAAKYGGGRVFVTVESAGPNLAVTVEDDGPGIPAAARDRIFQRGVRLDTDKPGTGLGLAIVRDVANIYGGDIELSESDDLGGLSVRLVLPRARQSTEERLDAR
ncbi:MAG: HAMP domain-containing sensor histidine kinase [Pacificimonas sp.]